MQDQLRADILFGRLEAGTPLQQERLCERFGVSRMPVRDALANLVYEGFVERTQAGGTVVSRVSANDLSDVLRAEALLHSVAARRVALRSDRKELAELNALADQMVAATKSRDVRVMSELNRQFHHRINQLSGSPKINAALRAVSLHADREVLVENPALIPRSNAQHAHILKAMAKGDADEAERAMFAHVWEGGLAAIEKLPLEEKKA